MVDRAEILGWVAEKAADSRARRDMTACKLLLEELRRDDDSIGEPESTLDALDNVTELRRPA